MEKPHLVSIPPHYKPFGGPFGPQWRPFQLTPLTRTVPGLQTELFPEPPRDVLEGLLSGPL